MREELVELEVRHGVARRVAVERLARRVAAVAADRRLNPAGAGARLAADERDVLAFELAVADEVLQTFVRLLGAGDDEQPRRVAVEAVDDARTVRLASRGAVLDERLRERAAGVPCAGVHDDARRFVDDEEVLVRVRDAEVGGRRLVGRLRTLGQLERDLLPGLNAVALGAPLAVDHDGLRGQESLGVRARAELVEGGEKAVEPRAGGVSGDADANDRTAPPRRGVTRRRRR